MTQDDQTQDYQAQEAPPVDDAHVAPGASLFSDPSKTAPEADGSQATAPAPEQVDDAPEHDPVVIDTHQTDTQPSPEAVPTATRSVDGAAATDPSAPLDLRTAQRHTGAVRVAPTNAVAPVDASLKVERKLARAYDSPFFRQHGGRIGRNLPGQSFYEKGDKIIGQRALTDLADGRNYLFQDGFVLDQDTVYVNSRDLPSIYQVGEYAGEALEAASRS